MERDRLYELLERLKGLRIAVVGDLILDKYVFGRVERISPEAPVPVFEIEREEFRAGGAANVALNLKSLGVGSVALFGRLGEDEEGRILSDLLAKSGVKLEAVFDGVPTTRKTRLVARSQQLIRIDREEKKPLSEGAAKRLLKKLEEFKPDAVVVSDYAKGVVTPPIARGVRGLGAITFADPKPSRARLYEGFDCITPNLKEFEQIAALLGVRGENFEERAAAVRKVLKLKKLVVTLSERGIALASERGVEVFPATAREVYDVTGAGDTVIATLAAAVSAGASWREACRLANLAAGVVVGKVGTATVSGEELLSRLQP